MGKGKIFRKNSKDRKWAWDLFRFYMFGYLENKEFSREKKINCFFFFFFDIILIGKIKLWKDKTLFNLIEV